MHEIGPGYFVPGLPHVTAHSVPMQDYIGAPWKRADCRSAESHYPICVGNSGLSLMDRVTMIEILRQVRLSILAVHTTQCAEQRNHFLSACGDILTTERYSGTVEPTLPQIYPVNFTG